MGEPTTPTTKEIRAKEERDIAAAPELSMYDLRKIAEHRGETFVLDNLYKELTRLSAKVNKVTEAKQILYVSELLGRMKQLESDITNLKSEITDLNIQKNKLKVQSYKILKFYKRQQSLHNYQKQLATLEKTSAELKEKRNNAQAEEVFDLSSQIRSLESKISSLESDIKNKEKRMGKVEEIVQTLEQNNKDKLEVLKTNIITLKKQILDKKTDCNRYEAKLTEAQRIVAEQKKLRQDIEKVKMIIKKLENETTVIKDKTIPEGTTLGTMSKDTESLLLKFPKIKNAEGLGPRILKQQKLLNSVRQIITKSEKDDKEDELTSFRKKIQEAIANAKALRERVAVKRELPNGNLQLRF